MKHVYTFIINFLSRHSFFLIILPLFFILNGYNQLFGFIPSKEVLINTASIFFFIALVFFVTKYFFRSFLKAAIFTFFLTLLFLTFGYLHDTLKDYFGSSFIVKYSFLLPILAVTFIYVFYTILKTKNPLNGLVMYLNVLMICLLLTEIYNSFKTFYTQLNVQNLIDPNFTAYKEYNPALAMADSAKPDIYFLLFDEMGGTSTLKER